MTGTKTVIGYAVNYDGRKGFGFAETFDLGKHPQRVFFHKDGAREVLLRGTTPVITNARVPDPYVHVGRNTAVLVMRVFEGHKGWRAANWGFRPGPNWVYDVMSAKTLDRFVGAMFNDNTDERPDETTPDRHLNKGMVTEFQLSPLTLTVWVRDPNTGLDDTATFNLERSGQQFLPDGSLAINLRVGSTGELYHGRRQLIFTPM